MLHLPLFLKLRQYQPRSDDIQIAARSPGRRSPTDCTPARSQPARSVEPALRVLEAVRDERLRDHVARNFESRARVLDDLARFGLQQHGPNWHRAAAPLEAHWPRASAEALERYRARSGR